MTTEINTLTVKTNDQLLCGRRVKELDRKLRRFGDNMDRNIMI
jgi:hypothetical protein